MVYEGYVATLEVETALVEKYHIEIAQTEAKLKYMQLDLQQAKDQASVDKSTISKLEVGLRGRKAENDK